MLHGYGIWILPSDCELPIIIQMHMTYYLVLSPVFWCGKNTLGSVFLVFILKPSCDLELQESFSGLGTEAVHDIYPEAWAILSAHGAVWGQGGRNYTEHEKAGRRGTESCFCLLASYKHHCYCCGYSCSSPVVYTASQSPSPNRYNTECRAVQALYKHWQMIPWRNASLLILFPQVHDGMHSCACQAPMGRQCRAVPAVAIFLGVGRVILVPPQIFWQSLMPSLLHYSFATLYTKYLPQLLSPSAL